MLLAEDKESFVSAKFLAESLKVPYQFMRQILQSLAKASIIETKEGLNGGVRISKSPNTISLKDLMELFQGKIQLVDCTFHGEFCHNLKHCSFKKEIGKIEQRLIKEFSELSIQKLIS